MANNHAAILGRRGGKASAKALNKLQRKERSANAISALQSKFKSPEERTAYYRDLQKKGVEARRRNKS